LENVRGHFGLGFREVLSDLTSIGYDARWTLIRASEVGAPHRRERYLSLPTPIAHDGHEPSPATFKRNSPGIAASNFDEYTHTDGQRCYLGQNYGNEVEYQGQSQLIASGLVQTITTHTDGDTRTQSRRASREVRAESVGLRGRAHERQARGKFRFSVEMDKETIPSPLDEGKLNVKFVEYMMGLPVGWVTDVDLPRSQKLKILGNGVVPQQAYKALELLCNINSYPQGLKTCGQHAEARSSYPQYD
jgi:DNA (cytosine-5)-methyltransferase 1